MLDQSSALYTLVDAATSLCPIPANDATVVSSPRSALCRETAVVSEDERSQSSSILSPDVAASSSSPVPSSPIADHAFDTPTTASPSFETSRRKKAAALPLVLMELLSDPSRTGDVLSFLPDGKAFAVRRPHDFANGPMMRELFQCVKFPTFVKKLEKWGFYQVNDGRAGRASELVFAHPLFRRGDWESCRKIRCVGKKRPSPASSPSPSSPANEAIGRQHGAFAKTKAMETTMMSLLRGSLLVPQEGQPMTSSAAVSAAVAKQVRLRSIARQRARQALRQRAALAAAVQEQQQQQQQQLQRLRRQTPSPLSSVAPIGGTVSQAEVDLATKAVVGAAMDVLARDGSCSPRPAPDMSAVVRSARRRAAAQAMSAERMNILRMEAELAATRKLEAELLATRRRQALLTAAMGGAL